MSHIPVLLDEVLESLNIEHGRKFIDGTVGDGGHTLAIAKKQTKAKILGIDLDQASLDNLRKHLTQNGLDQRIRLVHGSYKDLDKITSAADFGLADGILLDLGFSSFQLDDAKRGLSFQSDGPLDMRFDLQAKLTADEVVNSYYPKELEEVITEFGEEKFARRITSQIIAQRKIQPIKTTLQLSEIIRSAVPGQVRFKANDNVRRVFQAIRIEVNHELDNLKTFLPKAIKALNPKGRLAIISFHSLEDRIVKEFFNQEASDCICPPEFPTCICEKVSTIKILTKKPILASETEGMSNPRSKSAKLRVAEKI